MKVGILGTGDISAAFMEAAAIAEIEAVAVYNRNLEKAQAFAEKYGLKAFHPIAKRFPYSDYDDFGVSRS